MEHWSAVYKMLSNRNIGLLSMEQQEKLRGSRVAICGLGGIGSPVAEMLCRLGVGKFNILDNGSFEPTNLNRQIYAFSDTNELLKTDVTESFLKRINSDVEVVKYQEVSTENVTRFLEGVDVIVLGIDTVIPCIVISREANKLGVPIVEGWAVAAGNVRVFTKATPTLEEVYELPTIGRSVEDITKQEETDLLMHTLTILQKQIRGLTALYPKTAMQRMEEKNEGTTLAPLVWLSCSLMAVETMKVILNWGEIALAPKFASYDPFTHSTMN